MESPFGYPVHQANRSAHPVNRALYWHGCPDWYRHRSAPSEAFPLIQWQASGFDGGIVGSDEFDVIFTPFSLLLTTNDFTQVIVANLGNVDVELSGCIQH